MPLTRQEADKFFEALGGVLIESKCNCLNNVGSFFKLYDCINEFTASEEKKEEVNLLLQGSFFLKDKPYVFTIREMEDVN